jgi:phage baseplate assembly protein W
MMEIAYPFRIDGRGRTADAGRDAHIRQMIEQVLFTSPGERVNRPTFGTGLQQLVFAPNSSELATATEFMVQSALQEWLGELIQVEAVQVNSQEATLEITVQYIVRRSQQRQVAQFSREM